MSNKGVKMKEIKNSKLNIILNAIGITLNSFNSLFFLIIVKRINGLGTSGIFSYAFSLCCLFYFISLYYNRTYHVSDINDNYSFEEYFSCRVITIIISLVLIIIFSLISSFDSYKIFVIFLIMLFRSVEALSECFYGVLQKNDELYKVGISLILKSLLGLLAFLIADYITKNLLVSIAMVILANILIFIVYDLKHFKIIDSKKITFSLNNIKKIMKETMSVCLFSVTALFLINCQKYILTYTTSNEIQSIFAIIIMPGTVVSLLGNYILMPFIGELTKLYNNKKFKSLFKWTALICLILLILGLFIFIVAYFIGLPVINIIFNINLNEYKMEFLVVLVGAILAALSTTLSNVLTILRENKKQLVLYVVLSLFTAMVSVVLINKSGITGASFSYLISYVLCSLSFIVLFMWKLSVLKKQMWR